MQFTLGQVVQATEAQYIGPADALGTRVTGWSIDSRTTAPGDVFFAIPGPTHDGHDFAPGVLRNGALAAVVQKPVDAQPFLIAEHSVIALQRLASWARQFWGLTIVGVTGSAGKTGTKDIIAALLSVRFRTGKTVGNFNNHLGLPLSILRIPGDSQVAVLEMGMNHAGEIRRLAEIAKPQIGVVTNVGYAHIENFESVDGIAAAKRELIESLPPNGLAVLNADDERVRKFRAAHPGPCLQYGFAADSDIRGESLRLSDSGSSFSVQGVEFETPLKGAHNASNILAGIAVATSLGIAVSELVDAIAQLQPGKMRGDRTVRDGITIINDSYNSNPDAVKSMLAVLRQEKATRHIAVLGEMLELGSQSEQLHKDIGQFAAEAGANVVIAIAGNARHTAKAAESRGVESHFFENAEDAGDFLRGYLQTGDAVLFKGSRGTHLENALARLQPAGVS